MYKIIKEKAIAPKRLGSQCTWLSAYLLLSPLLPARPEGQHLPSPVRAWPGPQVELREGSPVGFCATTNPLPQPVSLLALPPFPQEPLPPSSCCSRSQHPSLTAPGMHPMPSLEPDDPSWEQPHPSMPSLAALGPHTRKGIKLPPYCSLVWAMRRPGFASPTLLSVDKDRGSSRVLRPHTMGNVMSALSGPSSAHGPMPSWHLAGRFQTNLSAS